jgi:hypothetical protein
MNRIQNKKNVTNTKTGKMFPRWKLWMNEWMNESKISLFHGMIKNESWVNLRKNVPVVKIMNEWMNESKISLFHGMIKNES